MLMQCAGAEYGVSPRHPDHPPTTNAEVNAQCPQLPCHSHMSLQVLRHGVAGLLISAPEAAVLHARTLLLGSYSLGPRQGEKGRCAQPQATAGHADVPVGEEEGSWASSV